MQGAHDWAKNLDKIFEEHSYYKSHADPQICSRVIDNEFILTSTWTDDILGILSTMEGEQTAKSQLSMSYEIKDMEKATLILGMQITQSSNGNVILSQEVYSRHMLK